MAYDSDREVTVLFGGADGPDGRINDGTWEWDGTNWTKLSLPEGPSTRTGHAMVYDAARRVTLLFGGQELTTGRVLDDTWAWNGAHWERVSPGSSPSARTDHAMAFDSRRGLVTLFGGCDQPQGCDDSKPGPAETWEWNGTTWSLVSPAISPPPRYGAGMTYDSARGITVMFGGTAPVFGPAGPISLTDTWEWNGSTWRQALSTPLPRK